VEARIVDASGLYASDPEVRAFGRGRAILHRQRARLAVNRYLVNTEGTVVRQGYTGYAANISVGGQAADGMQLAATTARSAPPRRNWRLARLPQARDRRPQEPGGAAQCARRLAEDYHGPVLFSGDAAADVMDRLFVPNVEADRPEMGTTARTQGAYTSSFHARVLPEFLNATDDPLMTTFDGHGLLGAYAVDDEGVPAQAVNVVVNGKLENYLIGRTPIRDFPESNGHGRAPLGQAAHSHSGVMIFKSSAPLSAAEMNARLLAMAKEQGRDVYAVETLGGELAPRLLYLVHPDGTRQLVRGAVFDELDNRSLRSDIVAAGDDEYVSNSLGACPRPPLRRACSSTTSASSAPPRSSRSCPTTPPAPASAAREKHQPLTASSAERDTAAPRDRGYGCCRRSGSRSPCPVLRIDAHPVAGGSGKLNHLGRRVAPHQVVLQLDRIRLIQETRQSARTTSRRDRMAAPAAHTLPRAPCRAGR
jgi:hypothetical protein